MWIKASTFEAMLTNVASAQAQARILEQQATATKTTMDWLMVRLTQLEHERAQLIFNYMGVKITVPEFSPAAPVGAQALSDIPSFQDVGDDEAAAQGLGWDSEGRATQHGKAID